MSVGIVLNDWICEWLKRFLICEIAGGFGLDFVLRGYADTFEVCVEVVGVEEAYLSARFVHGDHTPHHHLAEVRQGEAQIVGGLLRVE